MRSIQPDAHYRCWVGALARPSTGPGCLIGRGGTIPPVAPHCRAPGAGPPPCWDPGSIDRDPWWKMMCYHSSSSGKESQCVHYASFISQLIMFTPYYIAQCVVLMHLMLIIKCIICTRVKPVIDNYF